jgi:hypothetical protein
MHTTRYCVAILNGEIKFEPVSESLGTANRKTNF